MKNKADVEQHYQIGPIAIRGDEWQVINFEEESGDIPLHISLRQDKNQFVINALKDDKWLESIGVFSYPLDQHESVMIDLKIDKGQAEIYCNDTKITEYPVPSDLIEKTNCSKEIEKIEVDDDETQFKLYYLEREQELLKKIEELVEYSESIGAQHYRLEPIWIGKGFQSINFTDEKGDIPLHISLRKNLNQIAINVRKDDAWQKDEQVSSFPLDQLDSVVIELKIYNGKAKIYCNDTEVAEYPADDDIVEKTECNRTIEKIETESADLQQKEYCAEREQELLKKIEELETENKMILENLFKVQEELEEKYMQGKDRSK